VATAGGAQVVYDKLLLATGASPRRLQDDLQSLIRSARPLDPTHLANPEISLSNL